MGDDWVFSLLSLVIAAIAYFTSETFRELLRSGAAKSMRILHLKTSSCASTVWDDLQGQITMHKCNESLPYRPYRGCTLQHAQGADSLEEFLSYFNALRPTQPSRRFYKPYSLDLRRGYFRTDARTLFVCLMASIENSIIHCHKWSYCHKADSVEFRFGQSFLILRLKGNVFEAQISVSCSNCATVNRRTKYEYEQILIHGYPPWFKETVTNSVGVTFSFPSLLNGNLRRGGWIVAVGLGDICDPLPYFTTAFGDFRELGQHHHRGGIGPYWKACNYLKYVVDIRFGTQFPENRIVQAAMKAINGMMEDHTASKTAGLLRNTPLENAEQEGVFASQLDKSQVEFAIKVFNHRNEFTATELKTLQPILRAVLAGAVRGLDMVFAHLNDCSFQIRGDFEAFLDRNPEVYLRKYDDGG